MGALNIVGSDCLEGKWGLINHKKEIEIDFYWSNGYMPKAPFPITNFDTTWTYSTLSWEIQRLTKDQMWLKTNFNGKEYYTKFKK